MVEQRQLHKLKDVRIKTKIKTSSNIRTWKIFGMCRGSPFILEAYTIRGISYSNILVEMFLLLGQYAHEYIDNNNNIEF